MPRSSTSRGSVRRGLSRSGAIDPDPRLSPLAAKGCASSSGVEEAGCKQIGARLKRAGMRWTVAGANAIIALRCCILSGRFEDFWERRAANAARGSSHKSDVHPPLLTGSLVA